MPLLSALSFPLCFTTSLIPLCHHLSLFHSFRFLYLSQFNSSTQSPNLILLPNLHLSIHFSPILISLHHRGVPLHSSSLFSILPSLILCLFKASFDEASLLPCPNRLLSTLPSGFTCTHKNTQTHRFINTHAEKHTWLSMKGLNLFCPLSCPV